MLFYTKACPVARFYLTRQAAGATIGKKGVWTLTEFVMTSPVGNLRLLEEDSVLTRLYFGGTLEDPEPPTELLRRARGQLEAYFAGTRQDFDLPIRFGGTAFQHEVWEALREIPYGKTSTYGQIAARIGRPRAVRAVGHAIGQNPISIIVPCHRVIGKDGTLTGFAGGLPAKARLLEREGVTAAK